jgi:hypothetical protein
LLSLDAQKVRVAGHHIKLDLKNKEFSLNGEKNEHLFSAAYRQLYKVKSIP